MLVVPYIELEDGAISRQASSDDEIGDFASKLAEHFKKVYLADLDGIRRNRPQLGAARVFCEEVPTLYEGGVRVSANVIDMLITGAERCVIGTATLRSIDDVRGAFKLSENITFKVDFGDGIESFDPHIAGRAFLDLARDVVGIGVSDIVVPAQLARDASAAKRAIDFSLGVFAPLKEREGMERLGVDYMVCKDYGSMIG